MNSKIWKWNPNGKEESRKSELANNKHRDIKKIRHKKSRLESPNEGSRLYVQFKADC